MTTVTAAGAPAPLWTNYPIDDGQSPVRHVKSCVGKGHGYEFVFEQPMTARQVQETLFVSGRHADGDVRLVPDGQEPSATWQVRPVGVDAATAWKTPVFRAAGEAVVYGRAALPAGLPAGVRAHLAHRTVPGHATPHPGNVHVWEQEGWLVHVTMGHGSYLPEATRLSPDAVSNDILRWFMRVQGLSPREAWKAFVDHWDEIHRQAVAAHAMALAGAGREETMRLPELRKVRR